MDRLIKDLDTATQRIVELERELGKDKTTLIENNKRLQAKIERLEHDIQKMSRQSKNTEFAKFVRYEDVIAREKEEKEELLAQIHGLLKLLRYVDKSKMPKYG